MGSGDRQTVKAEDAAGATVRRRWNDAHSASVKLQHLRDVRSMNDPGGVCSALPRPFLFAKVWCDHLLDADGLHVCRAATAPHELELCVPERDNSPEIFAAVRLLLRR